MVYFRTSRSITIHTTNKYLNNYTKPESTGAVDLMYVSCHALNNGTQKHVSASD